MDLLFFLSCVCYAFMRVSLYVHALWSPDFLALVCDVYLFHFPIGILGQVWYLIVSILDLCTLTYFIVTAFIMLIWIEN